MIKEIRYDNFKGKSATFTLTGKDLIYGENATGKSAVLQAVALAVQGYLPGGLKRAEDVFQYATGDSMSVGLMLDNDFEFTRTWSKIRKTNKAGEETVSITQDIQVSPSRGENTNATKEMRIFSEIGRFPLIFDFEELNGMSDGKRRSFIYEIAKFDKSKYNAAFIEDYLMKKTEIITNTELLARATAEIKTLMTKFKDDDNFEISLESLKSYILNRALEFKAQRLEASAASRKLMEYKNQISETDRGLETARAEYDELDNKIESYSSDMATEQAKITESAKLCARADKLREKLFMRETQKSESENLIKKLEERKNTFQTDYKIEDAEALSVEVKKIDDQYVGLSIKSETLYRKVNKLEGEIYYLDKEKAKYKNACCPVNSEWKCPFDFKKSAEELQIKIDQLSAELQEVSKERKEIQDQMTDLLNDKVEKTENAITIKSAVDRMTRDNEIASADLKREKETLITLKKGIQEVKTELAQTEKDFENAGRGDLSILKDMNILLDGFKTRRAELKQIISDKEKAKHSLETMLQAVNESKSADENFLICNTIYQDLGAKGVQGQIVKDILEPLEQKINDKLIKFPQYTNHRFTFITVSDTGQEVFRYGWTDAKHNTVLYPALSTSEKNVLTAVIMTALLESIDIESRLLIFDNIENFDENARSAFMHELAEMGDKFDNILIAGVLSKDQAEDGLSNGFNIWKLS